VTDLDRPGGASRYTWSDDDDTLVPVDGDTTQSSAAARLVAETAPLGNNEHDLNEEVAALEAEEAARQAAATDDLTTDVPPEDVEVVAGSTGPRPDLAALMQQADIERARERDARAKDLPQKEYSDVVYVFEPNTKALPPLREYLSDLWARRKFMIELARAESRGSRSSTVLGELWAVIDPLFQVALYWFLLSIIRQGKGAQSGSLSQNLVLMVGGIFLFSLTSTTVTAGGRSILSAKNLMLNSTFPRALLPLSAAYKAVVEFIPTIFIYLVFHFAFGQSFGMGVFMLPLLFVIQMVMGIGLGLMFATFTVYLRDTTNILGYIMRVLFFATPVIYPATAIPDSLLVFLRLNPLLSLFTAYQAVILGGVPNPVDVVVSGAWATLFIVLGYRLFVANEKSFALRL
jgi:ABC-type polysaccharide/polyol phosphate export permease